MDSTKYKKNMERLSEIEAKVKDPNVSLGDIDALLEETKRLVRECYAYTHGLSEKVAELDAITPESVAAEAAAAPQAPEKPRAAAGFAVPDDDDKDDLPF